MTVEEGKAKRKAGIQAMTPAEKIRRDLTGGRPPAGELKTPLSAVTAARILHREIESRLIAEGVKPKPGTWGVSVGYVALDLSTLGFTSLFQPPSDGDTGNGDALLEHLNGNIPIGLVFCILDKAAEDGVVVGTRAFFTTKQTEDWLTELVPIIRTEL